MDTTLVLTNLPFYWQIVNSFEIKQNLQNFSFNRQALVLRALLFCYCVYNMTDWNYAHHLGICPVYSFLYEGLGGDEEYR